MKKRVIKIAALVVLFAAVLVISNVILNRGNDAEYWEKKYPSYRFCGYEKPAEMCLNPYNGYWYLTVVLYKRE